MSARILTVATLLASVAIQPAIAQGKTDFSGTWKMNVEKSDPIGQGMGGGGGGGGTATAVAITQKDGKLLVATTRGDQTTTATFNLDGTESVNASMRGGETKSKATWDGATLVIASESTFNGPNGSMTVNSKEVRSLSADGTMMTVVTTRTTPNGEQTTKRVFDKQ